MTENTRTQRKENGRTVALMTGRAMAATACASEAPACGASSATVMEAVWLAAFRVPLVSGRRRKGQGEGDGGGRKNVCAAPAAGARGRGKFPRFSKGERQMKNQEKLALVYAKHLKKVAVYGTMNGVECQYC